MTGSWKRFVVAAALSATTTLPAPAAPPDARAAFEALARRLPVFPAGDFVYHRVEVHGLTPEWDAEYKRAFAELTDPRHDFAALVELLRHRDPKVRTLAAAALFAKDDPKALPHLAPLRRDAADTFPAPQVFAQVGLPVPGVRPPPPPTEPQTVGLVADFMVRMYLGEAGYFYGGDETGGEKEFADYWAGRKDRATSASWFAVQLAQASGGTSPTQKDRLPAIRAVRARIDRLPEPDRTFTLLWLEDRPGGDALATEADRVAACRTVGPDALLKLVDGRVPTDDPDLRFRPNNNYRHVRMAVFVLRHAKQVLRPGDADAVLESARRATAFTVPPDYYVAAAELRPAKAKEILLEGWDKFSRKGRDEDHRSRLALAYWRLAAGGDPAFVVEWFYVAEQQRGQFPNCRAALIRGLGPTPRPGDRKLLAAIAADARFGTLDWQTLQEMVQLVGEWDRDPVVPAEDVRRAWHPLGMGHFHWEVAKAAADYPKETADLMKTLEAWRQALRVRLATGAGPRGDGLPRPR